MKNFILENWRLITVCYFGIAALWSLWTLKKICKIKKLQDEKKKSSLMKKTMLYFVIVFFIIILALVLTLSIDNIYKMWPLCLIILLLMAFMLSINSSSKK